MRTDTIIGLLLAAFIVAGCGQRKTESFEALSFPDVTVPSMMESAQQRADYLAEHFWDRLTDPERVYPSDSSLVSGVLKEDVEQKFANWISVLDMTDLKVSEKAVSRLFRRISECEKKDSSSNVFETITALSEKYLYDPNSPLRNEEYYLYFARHMASYGGNPQEVRDKYAYQARVCALNRLGTKAADFRFADRHGRMHTLHGIEAPLTLLFFSNPGCDACMNIIEMLKGEPAVSRMISEGVLAVLNIYIDEDIAAWRDYMPVYPDNWYNGFDPDLVIRTDNLYNVRAIPSLYLLDKEKGVILKDAPESKVMSYLTGIRF